MPPMIYLTPQQYFKQRDIRPKKRFGQHFLAQPKTAELIVRSAALEPGDVVVEVGPGLGALTQFILPGVRSLHVVELDSELAEYLREATPDSMAEFTVHQQDVLDFDFKALSQASGQRLVVLGNLPYNISSPLVFRLLEARQFIQRTVFMVQKEVGERLAASPGSKDYGVLSVLLGIYGRVSRLFTVGPGQFFPPPKVDSLVVRIEFPEMGSPESVPFDFVRELVNAAFQKRRKTLWNSLKGFGRDDLKQREEALSRLGIDPMRRPETLAPEEFLKLAVELKLKEC